MKFLPAGDRAMIVEFGSEIDDALNNQVHVLAKKLEESQIRGVLETVPTFRSLLIYYEPGEIKFGQLQEKISAFGELTAAGSQKKKRILKIPCCYGARFGQDLGFMEKHTGLTRDEIIAIHSSVDYKIYMLGFLPGFVYLGGLDKRLEMPRMTTPRVKIQPGAVGIGGSQTGVYPLASPGGWRLMGGTPVDFYDPDRENPILCQAGEYIRFVPISIDDYYDIRREVVKGTYQVEAVEEGGEPCQ
ncbi:allophanate hydrolase [Blautia sp. An249]|nr:allophanate hydrolase [Blautia sp. An249]